MKKNMFSAIAIVIAAVSLTSCSKDASLGNDASGPSKASDTVMIRVTPPVPPSKNLDKVAVNQSVNSGSVTGILFPAPRVGEIQIYDDQGVVVAEGKPNAKGEFAIDKMLPGNYLVVIRYIPNKKRQTNYRVKKFPNVVVQEGQTTSLGVIFAY